MQKRILSMSRGALASLVTVAAIAAGPLGAEASSTSSIAINAELDRSVLTIGKSHRAHLRASCPTPARRTDAKRALMNVALVIDRSGSMGSSRE